jgi:hypothetical protein
MMNSTNYQLRPYRGLVFGYSDFYYPSVSKTFRDHLNIFEMGELLEFPESVFDLLIFQAPEPVQTERFDI